MKNKLLISMFALAVMATGATKLQAQSVQVNNGPDLTSDPDANLNRMIEGDENSFYCYRVRSKGKGTSFFIEKYDKKTMKLGFSKEVDLGESKTKLEDLMYADNTLYVFMRQYDKEGDKMRLQVQTVSSAGVVSPKKTEITSVSSDHYEFVEFDMIKNTVGTKFLVKSCHKPNKDGSYTTDFILVSFKDMKIEWTKTVDGKLFSVGDHIIGGGMLGFNFKVKEEFTFLGLILDKDDNFYYAYTQRAKSSTDKEIRYVLNFAYFEVAAKQPKVLAMPFEDSYQVSDVEFSRGKTPTEIVMAGFLKDVIERRGSDLVKCGIFSFTIDVAAMKVMAHPIKMFDDKMLTQLESSPKRSKYFKYKLDYIFTIGEEVYYVGEQYREQYVSSTSSYGSSFKSSSHWEYEYMDVIIAKVNAKGEFDWITNAPLRNLLNLPYAHVFKQYFAVPSGKNIYIFNNDHPKNIERYQKADFEPSDLKSVSGIHGSIFVFSAVSTATGKVTHKLIFENEKYCFAPIQERNLQFVPPEDAEIFVPGAPNEFYVYTEDRGKDRFVKLKIQE